MSSFGSHFPSPLSVVMLILQGGGAEAPSFFCVCYDHCHYLRDVETLSTMGYQLGRLALGKALAKSSPYRRSTDQASFATPSNPRDRGLVSMFAI
jgi:hypothetical protein